MVMVMTMMTLLYKGNNVIIIVLSHMRTRVSVTLLLIFTPGPTKAQAEP